MGIFMSVEQDRSRNAVISDLKTQINRGEKLSVEALEKVTYGNSPNVFVYLQLGDYKELALYALEQNKTEVFKLIAESQDQSVAQELQLAKLKKEIDDGKAPNIKAEIYYTETVSEDRGEVSGFASATQDHERREIIYSEEKKSCQVSSENQIALVNYALEQNKFDTAKQLVVQLSDDNLKKYSNNKVLGETVKEESAERQIEAQKNQLMSKLGLLETQIKTLKKDYEKRASATFDWFRGDTASAKNKECVLMLNEITRLKDLLKKQPNNNVTWTFDEKKEALEDKKTLYGHAKTLDTLKQRVESFVKPAPSAAAAHSI